MPDQKQRSRPDLGRANRRSVLAEILFNAPIARTDIAEITGLTGATVSRICRDLVSSNLIHEKASSTPLNRSGRRTIELTLNPDGAYFLGVGINAFVQWVSIYGLNNNVLAYEELSIDSLADPIVVLEQVVNKAEEMIQASAINLDKLIGGGVAIAGVVEPHSGKLLFSPTLDWGELEVSSIMSERLGFPVCVETFPNTLNLAETRFGIAKGYSNVVLINASLRMGASLLLDNQLRRGTNYSAGLIGELPLQQSQSTGDQEMYLDDVAAGAAVINKIRGEQGVTSGRKAANQLQQLKQASIKGDPAISDAFKQAGKMLSYAISTVTTLLQPDVIIIAGPMSSVPSYIEGVLENIHRSKKARTAEIPIMVSEISSEEAVRLLTYNEFLARRDIDLIRLSNTAV
ncbi:MAG: ROK family transcriptional regulator [Motiliproteus sp.]